MLKDKGSSVLKRIIFLFMNWKGRKKLWVIIDIVLKRANMIRIYNKFIQKNKKIYIQF